jgi:lysophospholipase L1-like esterase
MELNNKTILFLGDSITEGHGVSDVTKRFTNLIAAKAGANCVNYGISGTRIARQHAFDPNERRDRDFCMRAEEMQDDADCIVVFGGTNDYAHGDAPFGSFSDRTPMTFYGALHTLYAYLAERYLGVPVVILTPLHRCSEDDGRVTRPYAYKPLKEYVAAIREVAEYYSFPVLDFFATSGLQPNVEAIKQAYVPDGLHPNDAGHEIMANKIIKFLETL